jgi:hypothetical protein
MSSVPIHYTIDPERRALAATIKGLLRDGDLLDFARSLLADPQRRLADHRLYDLRDIEPGSEVTPEAIRELAGFLGEMADQANRGKMALIADTDFAFGMARMYQSYRVDGLDRIRVFRSPDEAWAWLEDPA